MEDSQQWGRAEWGRLDQLGTAAVPYAVAQLDEGGSQAERGKLDRQGTAAALDKAVVQLDNQAGGSLRSQPEGRGQGQPEVGLDKQYRGKEEEQCYCQSQFLLRCLSQQLQ